MQTIKIIKSEHRNLTAILYTLQKLIEEIDNGKHADFAIFHGLFTYINRFLDRYHHPKESEYLFPRVMQKSPEHKPLVEKLGRQHAEGEKMFIDMLKALSAYEFSGEEEYAEFRERVLEYVHFEREHALLEEKEILPLAKRVLDDSDWEAIDGAFATNKDPMFGDDWSNQFSELFKKILNDLPQPLGLGESWK